MESVKAGEAPLWNPYIGLGRPFLADLQNAVFYPPTYLLLIGRWAGVFLLVWLHALLAMAGVVWLGKRVGAPFGHGLLLGLCLLLSAQFSGRLLAGQLMYWCGACYVPVLLGFCYGLTTKWSWRSVAVLAFVFFLQLLCGHPQIFWISSIGVGLFGLGLTFYATGGWQERLRIPAQLAVALIWSFVLGAFVLLPFAELVTQGNRSAPSLGFAGFHGLDWKDWRGLVMPPMVDWEKNVYIGFVLAGGGLLALLKAKFRLPIFFLMVFGFLFALGNNTPVFKLFYYGLPGTAGFRLPGRMALLLVMGVIAGALMVSAVTRRKHWLLVLLVLALLEVGFETYRLKLVYNYESASRRSAKFPLYTNAVEILARENLVQEGKPPPRVHLHRDAAPSNFAIYSKYSSTDAYTSLFLKRPWDYLHRAPGVEPEKLQNTFLNKEVYEEAFPYSELDQVLGFSKSQGEFVVRTNGGPRVFLNGESNGVARIVDFRANRIELEYRSDSEGLIVLKEPYYPGWKLLVGGKEVENFPVNGWMRGFQVPAGEHRAVAVFQQNHLRSGGTVSAAAFFLLFLAWRRGRNVVGV